MLSLFDVEKGQAPGLGNLHVFDGIETIPLSVNIWMRCHLSPILRWHWGLVLWFRLFLDWEMLARRGKAKGAVRCDARSDAMMTGDGAAAGHFPADRKGQKDA